MNTKLLFVLLALLVVFGAARYYQATTVDEYLAPDGTAQIRPPADPWVEPPTGPPPPFPSDTSDDFVACTMDAKECPDGSFVGRVGPDCEFAACPSDSATPSDGESTLCDPNDRPEFCTEQYEPVCGAVQVECVTTPCDPVPETFSNACTACSIDRVVSYTAGACTQ